MNLRRLAAASRAPPAARGPGGSGRARTGAARSGSPRCLDRRAREPGLRSGTWRCTRSRPSPSSRARSSEDSRAVPCSDRSGAPSSTCSARPSAARQLAFLVARYLAADWVARKAGGRLGRLIAGVEAEGWRFVAFVPPGATVPVQPVELRARAHAHPARPLRSRLARVHGPRRHRVYLARLRRPRGAGRRCRGRAFGLLGLGTLAAIAFLPRVLRRFRRAPAWVEVEDLKRRTRCRRADNRGGCARS